MTDEELSAIREEVRQITAFIESQRAAFAGSVWWREDAIGITATKHATALLAEIERLRKSDLQFAFGKCDTCNRGRDYQIEGVIQPRCFACTFAHPRPRKVLHAIK